MSIFVTVWATSKVEGQTNQRERASDLRKRAFGSSRYRGRGMPGARAGTVFR